MNQNSAESDMSSFLREQIKVNEEIKKSISGNDDKYKNLLNQVQEIRNSAVNIGTVGESSKSIEEKLKVLEDAIKDSSDELKALKYNLINSTNLLEELAFRIDSNTQYPMRDNLLIKGLRNIPYHLIGYQFSTWVARTINNLIPSLDFPIVPEHISTSHPIYKNSNVIIVRFAIRDVRNEIFYKKDIHDKRVSISEHLTKKNLLLLNAAKQFLGPKNAWSSQTKLYGKVGSEVVAIFSQKDLDLLQGMKASYDSLPPALTADLPPTSVNNSIMPSTSDNILNSQKRDSVVANPATQSVSSVPQQNFESILKTWPDLTEADLIEAMNSFLSKGRHNNQHAYWMSTPHERGRGFRGRGRPRFRNKY